MNEPNRRLLRMDSAFCGWILAFLRMDSSLVDPFYNHPLDMRKPTFIRRIVTQWHIISYVIDTLTCTIMQDFNDN